MNGGSRASGNLAVQRYFIAAARACQGPQTARLRAGRDRAAAGCLGDHGVAEDRESIQGVALRPRSRSAAARLLDGSQAGAEGERRDCVAALIAANLAAAGHDRACPLHGSCFSCRGRRADVRLCDHSTRAVAGGRYAAGLHDHAGIGIDARRDTFIAGVSDQALCIATGRLHVPVHQAGGGRSAGALRDRNQAFRVISAGRDISAVQRNARLAHVSLADRCEPNRRRSSRGNNSVGGFGKGIAISCLSPNPDSTLAARRDFAFLQGDRAIARVQIEGLRAMCFCAGGLDCRVVADENRSGAAAGLAVIDSRLDADTLIATGRYRDVVAGSGHVAVPQGCPMLQSPNADRRKAMGNDRSVLRRHRNIAYAGLCPAIDALRVGPEGFDSGICSGEIGDYITLAVFVARQLPRVNSCCIVSVCDDAAAQHRR